MGKVTNNTSPAPEYPGFVGGNLFVDGKPLATTGKFGDAVVTNYYNSPYDSYINDYVQKSLMSSLPQLNTFLPETVQRMNTEIEAFKNKGIENIKSMYNPMVRDLQNDVATRFGNLDNSMFMENLKGIEAQRGQTINQFAQDLQAKQSQLYNDELQRRYDYVNMLMGVQDNQYNNMLKALGVSQNNASLGNSQAQQAYQASYRQFQQNNTDDTWKKVLALALTSSGIPGGGTVGALL